MYRSATLAVVLAVAHAGQSSILYARQSDVPTLPTGGFGTCGGPCNAWEKIITDCGTDAGADGTGLLKCYCTQDYVSAMGQCYDCLVPLVQSAGTDPSFAQDAQAAIDDFEQACAQEGFGVSSVTITGGGGGGAGPTPSTGVQKTPTPATSAGSSPSATAPGGSGSSGGSGTPTGLPGKNAAANTGAASSMVLAGVVGGVVAFFGL